MPCDYEDLYVDSWEDPVAMAEMGLSPEEIADLQARATLARESARRQGYVDGLTRQAQQDAIDAAIEAAVKEWHLEQHAVLEGMMSQIKALGAAKKVPHA